MHSLSTWSLITLWSIISLFLHPTHREEITPKETGPLTQLPTLPSPYTLHLISLGPRSLTVPRSFVNEMRERKPYHIHFSSFRRTWGDCKEPSDKGTKGRMRDTLWSGFTSFFFTSGVSHSLNIIIYYLSMMVNISPMMCQKRSRIENRSLWNGRILTII